jgi:hypothetical protein
MAKGHPKKPLTEAELEDKFYQCAAGRLARGNAERFVEAIRRLETVRSLSATLRLLCPGRR